jgi:proteasome lid subunit RPN8/RPN11
MEISQRQYSALIELARNALPHEACGLLAGEPGIVRDVIALTNVEHNPAGCGWRADSREQLRAFERIDDMGWQLLAIYHSHPRSAAHPSERDIEHALYPDAMYVIVSLLNPDAPEIGAFRIAEGVVRPAPLSISSNPTAGAQVTPEAR